MESNIEQPFIKCNNEKCASEFRYLDNAIHDKIGISEARDHCANERNLLTWLRTGVTLSLIGFMTIVDLSTKKFAPALSFPWTNDSTANTNIKVVSYIFILLGMISIITSTMTYFRNQQQIIKRLYHVGQGFVGYFMALVIMLFVCFIMIIALFERRF
ncbi:unnamed protein product [Cunninghamella echinulata]